MVGPGTVSEKCRYALRAIFDLALRDTTQPVKIQEIASTQGIPQRFLEVILAELKHGGFVGSQRGADGGYVLLKPAKQLTVGEVIRFMQGSDQKGSVQAAKTSYALGDCVFEEMWQQVTEAVDAFYNGITFSVLIERELAKKDYYTANYVI